MPKIQKARPGLGNRAGLVRMIAAHLTGFN
jgi:hypothetical protein